jgi:hypothetical protein
MGGQSVDAVLVFLGVCFWYFRDVVRVVFGYPEMVRSSLTCRPWLPLAQDGRERTLGVVGGWLNESPP